jgi:PAS domain-containing protein
VGPLSDDVIPDPEDLCRIHELSLEMLENIDDLDALLKRILDEYEKRLRDIPDAALGLEGEPVGVEGAKQVRALVMFASQAAAIKAKAESAHQCVTARRRVEGVLAALDTGVLIAGGDDRIEHANRAAAEWLGESAESLVGRLLAEFTGNVEPGEDGEVRRDGGAARHVLLVGRRPLPEGGGEVVTLRDVTERDRAIEQRHQLERLDAMFHTLGALGHKINNTLTALLGRAQILEMQKRDDPAVAKPAHVIVESATRIADLVREMTKVLKEGRQEALDALLDFSREHREGEAS